MTDSTDEWFADDAFWEATYPFMFPETRFAGAGDEIDRVLALAGMTRGTGGAVLDLACGPGRHSLALASRGFAVTGVDRSAFLLDRARARAAELGAAAEWVHADMRDFTRPAAFDLALCLFTSFGYFADDADNQRVLAQVVASLRPGGRCVLDVAGKEVLARIFSPADVRDIPNGMVVHRRTVEDGWSRMRNEWTLLQGGTSRAFRFAHWIYSGRELALMFEQAGFADVRLCGDFGGAPYGPASGRLIVIGRKPV